MPMLCVLYSKINYKPSNKLFPLKMRAILRNINIDWTTFFLLKHCFYWVYPPIAEVRPKSVNICDNFVWVNKIRQHNLCHKALTRNKSHVKVPICVESNDRFSWNCNLYLLLHFLLFLSIISFFPFISIFFLSHCLSLFMDWCQDQGIKNKSGWMVVGLKGNSYLSQAGLTKVLLQVECFESV